MAWWDFLRPAEMPQARSTPEKRMVPANDDLASIRETPHFHYEYQAVHNQRIATGRIIHVWYQIAFAASPLIFGQILSLAKDKEGQFVDGWLMLGAVGAGAVPLIVALVFGVYFLDRSIVSYYPRLLALELILGFQFWRQNLRNQGGAAYVEACERKAVGAAGAVELWNRVRDIEVIGLPPWRRGHRFPFIAALVLGALYVVLIGYLWFSGPGNAGWQRILKCLFE